MSEAVNAPTAYACRVDLPDAPWLEVPTGRDPRAWARSAAHDLLPDRPALAAALADDLALHARTARDLGAFLTAVVLPDPAAGVLAALTVAPTAPAGLAEVSRAWADGGPDLARPPEVTRRDLPAGPAVRARLLARGAPDETGRRALIEAVLHHVAPPGTAEAVEVRLTWLAVPLGDALADLADEVAAGLSLVPLP